MVLLLSASVLSASEVVDVRSDKTIVVSQRSAGGWNLDDYVCVFRDRAEVACGPVVELTAETATVKLKFQKEPISPGDLVELSAEAVAKGTMSEEQAMAAQPLPANVTLVHNYSNNVSLGLEGGSGFVFPFLSYRMALQRRTCVTFKGGYWAGDPTAGISQIGAAGFVGVSYYREKCFTGLWASWEGGAVVSSVSGGGVSSPANSLSLGVLTGYEAAITQQITLNLVFGSRYFTTPNTGAVQAGLSTFIFFGGLSLGANF